MSSEESSRRRDIQVQNVTGRRKAVSRRSVALPSIAHRFGCLHTRMADAKTVFSRKPAPVGQVVMLSPAPGRLESWLSVTFQTWSVRSLFAN